MSHPVAIDHAAIPLHRHPTREVVERSHVAAGRVHRRARLPERGGDVGAEREEPEAEKGADEDCDEEYPHVRRAIPVDDQRRKKQQQPRDHRCAEDGESRVARVAFGIVEHAGHGIGMSGRHRDDLHRARSVATCLPTPEHEPDANCVDNGAGPSDNQPRSVVLAGSSVRSGHIASHRENGVELVRWHLRAARRRRFVRFSLSVALVGSESSLLLREAGLEEADALRSDAVQR